MRDTLIVDDDAHQSGKLKSLGLYFAKRAMKRHVKCEARE
jgi:hypothetical protein